MKKTLFGVFSILVIASFLLAACGPSSSLGDITFVIGDGTYDQKIHEIVYPNQQVSIGMKDLTTRVAPGNYRNYVINDGTQLVDGEKVGDSDKLLDAVLPSETRIQVGLTALWMLNQDAKIVDGEYEGPLVDFYKFASKYNALNPTNDPTGNVRSSTSEWNQMLAENYPSALSQALSQALYNIQNDYDSLTGERLVFSLKIDDRIWKNGDVLQKAVLANEISRVFQSKIAPMTGSNLKMFCGSGAQSGWTDPDPKEAGQPGNSFKCADVRIQIDSVIYNPDQSNTSGSQSLIDANQARYKAAYELYHEQTSCWLGILAAIEACKGSAVPCTFIIDGSTCSQPAESTPTGNTLILPNYPETPTVEGGTIPAPTTTP